MAEFEPFQALWADGPAVRGHLHRPSGSGTDGIVLAHGAGGDCDSPLLVAIARAFAASGLAVLRCDLPYRQLRRVGPPRPADASRDREGLRRAVLALRGLAPGRAFVGGQSYGGRQASMLLADDPAVAEGLLLLAYPLHPPTRPTTLRTAHFPSLRTPALFVHGSKDPFGTLTELRVALALIPVPTALVVVEGAAHDLLQRRGSLGAGVDVAAEAVTAFQRLIG